MSLKKFHIFFIAISTLLCFGMVFWGVYDFKAFGNPYGWVYAVIGIVGTGLLAWYLQWFLKKYPRLSVFFLTLPFLSNLFFPPEVQACTVCFKDPNSPLVQSTVSGVWFLLAIITGILLSIIFIARSWLKKARSLNRPL